MSTAPSCNLGKWTRSSNLGRTLIAFLSLSGPLFMEAHKESIRLAGQEISVCVFTILCSSFPVSFIMNPCTLSRCSQSYVWGAFHFWPPSSVLLPSFHFYYRSNQQQRLLHGARWWKPWLPPQVVARFITSLPPTAIRGTNVPELALSPKYNAFSRTLVAFNAATMHD